ncbi:lipid-A-disaccharide synthase [Pelagibius litoralis]|uniref:Lipid-A-disaccharide synthase n=1 Tax=Pelagibius litoralis TaxID=374515 RepID=A0A967EUP0_9PROT|nr:lipid-A-disaccharide synthase [Pelagibius litoralis]NIA67307.1 lipid-A-disaccharide synthase [Pelagibius litoralis]
MTAIPGVAEEEREDPLVFLIAGEPSGDLLAARLMAAMKAESGNRLRFAGIGGEQMTAQGLKSLFPIHEFAVMGFVEVLPHLFKIIMRIRQTVAIVKSLRPDVVITIDSPSFTLEVAQRLKGEGIPLVHYVAPQVWAWKAGRAKRMARYLDLILALLPFEPPLFEKNGLKTRFVGHPAVELAVSDEQRLADRLPKTGEGPLLAVLPGSRKGEVRKLLPVFEATVAVLAERHPGLRVVIPTVETVEAEVRQRTASWTVPVEVVRGAEAKQKAFAEAQAALAASGTVALELAVASVPAVIAYRLSGIGAFLSAGLLTVPYVSLVNLIAERLVQPELLQGNCTVEKLVEPLESLLSDPQARQTQRSAYLEVVRALTPAEGSPSRCAAREVLDLLSERRGKNPAPAAP